jgi:hypothetical protein
MVFFTQYVDINYYLSMSRATKPSYQTTLLVRQAASTDILSYAYGQHETEGYLAAFYSDRYQGLKRAASTASEVES